MSEDQKEPLPGGPITIDGITLKPGVYRAIGSRGELITGRYWKADEALTNEQLRKLTETPID